MITILVVCAVLVTISVIVSAVFLVQALIHISRTAHESEILLKGCNEEVELVKGLTSNITSFADKYGAPWFKTGAWITGIASFLIKQRFRKKNKED